MKNRKEVGILSSATNLGIKRLEAQESYMAKVKAVFREEGKISELYDYVFGVTDENPLEPIRKDYEKAIEKIDNSLEELIEKHIFHKKMEEL